MFYPDPFEDERDVIRIPRKKPRVKNLNEALVDLGGGRMKNPKDRSRAREKQELRTLLQEKEED
jgi:hypothetical protein